MTFMTSLATATLLQHLLHEGPCTLEELHQHLLSRGRTKAKTPHTVRTTLISSVLAIELPDGRWDTTLRRLTRSIFTVRPRNRLRERILWVHQDLEPLDALAREHGFALASGGFARSGSTELRTLVGPEGWLPEVDAGEVLGLRWDGRLLHVEGPVDVPALTDPRVLRARELLRVHSHVLGRDTWRDPGVGRWSRVILSALQEDPDLFGEPLPPLNELLPLPEVLADDSSLWESHRDGRRITLHLPPRVYDELGRRADLLGDRLVDYAGMLLGAATDRLQPAARCSCSYDDEPTPSWARYEPEDDGRVIDIGGWQSDSG